MILQAVVDLRIYGLNQSIWGCTVDAFSILHTLFMHIFQGTTPEAIKFLPDKNQNYFVFCK